MSANYFNRLTGQRREASDRDGDRDHVARTDAERATNARNTPTLWDAYVIV